MAAWFSDKTFNDTFETLFLNCRYRKRETILFSAELECDKRVSRSSAFLSVWGFGILLHIFSLIGRSILMPYSIA